MDSASGNLDVLILGGGPAGTTVGCLLKKYHPSLRVGILEKARFPREHVGESLLPPACSVLHEMGAWDAVESAGFPVKVGATYRWGRSPEPWDFHLVPPGEFVELPRPRRFEGQVARLALQVERSRYDELLLHQAQSLGCIVRQEAPVVEVLVREDRVLGVRLRDHSIVQATWYVDATGGAATIRRALGVPVEPATRLQNIALWDYWELPQVSEGPLHQRNRVLVLSVAAGWLWVIPLGGGRTSIGYVCPQEHYRSLDRDGEEIYLDAVQSEPMLARLVREAPREGYVRATRDWSFVATRHHGANWLLVGECAGFADPILAAGMTLAHLGGREAAFTLVEILRGHADTYRLLQAYEDVQRRRIGHHIRFADFWYSANGLFTDLEDYTRTIAREAGLDLDPAQAFRWLATGGFTEERPGFIGVGGFEYGSIHRAAEVLLNSPTPWRLSGVNHLELDLAGARRITLPRYHAGTVTFLDAWERDHLRVAEEGVFRSLLHMLEEQHDVCRLLEAVAVDALAADTADLGAAIRDAAAALELMLTQGWLKGTVDPTRPMIDPTILSPSQSVESGGTLPPVGR